MKAARGKRRREEKLRIKRRESIRNLAVLGLVGVVLISLYLYSNRPAEALAPREIISLGERVYAESCIACHGQELKGHVALAEAPALNGSEHSWHHADGQIQTLINEGGQVMPALGEQLTEQEIVAVIRYVQTWWSADQLAFQQNASANNPMR